MKKAVPIIFTIVLVLIIAFGSFIFFSVPFSDHNCGPYEGYCIEYSSNITVSNEEDARLVFNRFVEYDKENNDHSFFNEKSPQRYELYNITIKRVEGPLNLTYFSNYCMKEGYDISYWVVDFSYKYETISEAETVEEDSYRVINERGEVGGFCQGLP